MTAPAKPTRPTAASQSRIEEGEGPAILSLESSLFQNIQVELNVRLGEVALSVTDLLSLKNGSLLTLDRLLSEPVDLFLNERLVARGEIVAVDDHYGVRLVEVGATE